MYNITDPSELLRTDPPTKSTFKEYIKTKILIFHENELRRNVSGNSSLLTDEDETQHILTSCLKLNISD